MTEACEQDFMLVGQGWSLDSVAGGDPPGLRAPGGAGLPGEPAVRQRPRSWCQPIPNPVDYRRPGRRQLAEEPFPDEVKKAAVMYANYAATIDSTEKVAGVVPGAAGPFLDCPQDVQHPG